MGNNSEYNDEKNKKILELMNNESFCPMLSESETGVSNYTRIPIEKLAALGIAFEPLTAAIQTAVNGAGGSGIYYVHTGGKTMFNRKGTRNYIGSLKTDAGIVGGGQALMSPIAFDPTMLFMAAAIVNIEKKLDEIKEMQQDMMNFLIQKEKSELRGSLTFLYDVYTNYKYNWNNEMYKKNNHNKVLDIRQMAEEKIDFYCSQIITIIKKKSLLHSDKNVGKQFKSIQEQFKEYQISLYLLAFSYFIEVILLENFDPDYLHGITDKLQKYSLNYRELYTSCYDELEDYSSSSVQTAVLKGLSKTSTAVGKFAQKVPFVRKTQADESLMNAGDKLSEIESEKIKKKMQGLTDVRDNPVKPFVDNIDMINSLYNKSVQMVADQENLYIGIME